MPIKTDQMRLLVDFFHQGNRLTYTKGDFINRPGQALPGVFYIEEGLVKSYDITKYGEENLLIIRKKAELLGLTWAITGKERAIIYSVLAPTTAWLMSREKFTDFVQGNPGAALPVLDMVADMYRLHSERIMTLEYRTVRERLISFLLTTSERFGRKVPAGILIDVPLKHQDIASSICATRETTSRAIADLERKGLLSSSQSLITLRDVKTLKSFL